MNNEEKHHATSDLLEKVVTDHTDDTVSVRQIKKSLHERGFGVLMAIFAIPLCLPFPAPPGYTTIFSVPLFILSIQMILGMDSPWLPRWFERKEIKRKRLSSLVEKAAPMLRKIERLLKPRLCFDSMEVWEKIIGTLSFIFAISIAVPLPLTNLPPGYGILIMSLGLLGKDGLTIVIGAIIGIIGCFITAFILIYGADVVMGFFSSVPAIEAQ